MHDFGRNTFHYRLEGRFRWLSATDKRRIADGLLQKGLVNNLEDRDEGVWLSRGEGTEESPLLSVILLEDAVLLWAGWHVSFKRWMKWQNTARHYFDDFIAGLSSSVIASVESNISIIVPEENLVPTPIFLKEIGLTEWLDHLTPMRDRINLNLLLTDHDAKHVVQYRRSGKSGETVGMSLVSQVEIGDELSEIEARHRSLLEEYAKTFDDGFVASVVIG